MKNPKYIVFLNMSQSTPEHSLTKSCEIKSDCHCSMSIK